MEIGVGNRVEWQDTEHYQYCTGSVLKIDTSNPKNVRAYVKHDKYYCYPYRASWISISNLTLVKFV